MQPVNAVLQTFSGTAADKRYDRLKYQSYVLLAELSSLVMRSIILKGQIRGKRTCGRGRKKKQIRGCPRICLYNYACVFIEFNTLREDKDFS